MSRSLVVVTIFILCLAICGCWNRVEVNDTAVASGLGIDLSDSGQIIFTYQFNKPVNRQEAVTSEPQFVVLSARGETVTEAARKLTLSLPRIPLWSHADTFVIGEKLAKKDLTLIGDFLARNRNIRISSFVVVTSESVPSELFGSTCPLALCSARGIIDILQWQEKQLGIYSPVILSDFLYRLTTPGIEPVAPRVTITKDLSGNKIVTPDGSAVFRGRRMVGYLNELESRGYRWLYPYSRQGGLFVMDSPINQDNLISLEIVNFHSKVRPVGTADNLHMKITVETELVFTEQTNPNARLNNKTVSKLEAAANREIEKQISSCIEKSQQLNSDILGWGRSIYCYKPKEWEKLKDNWDEIYPQVGYSIEVKTRLQSSNVFIGAFQPQ